VRTAVHTLYLRRTCTVTILSNRNSAALQGPTFTRTSSICAEFKCVQVIFVNFFFLLSYISTINYYNTILHKNRHEFIMICASASMSHKPYLHKRRVNSCVLYIGTTRGCKNYRKLFILLWSPH